MLNSVLFGSYLLSCSAIVGNMAKIKYQDDLQREIKEYREYDFNNEKIKKEIFDKSQTAKCIILAKYYEDVEEDKILYQKEIAIFNNIDPARSFKAKPKQ